MKKKKALFKVLIEQIIWANFKLNFYSVSLLNKDGFDKRVKTGPFWNALLHHYLKTANRLVGYGRFYKVFLWSPGSSYTPKLHTKSISKNLFPRAEWERTVQCFLSSIPRLPNSAEFSMTLTGKSKQRWGKQASIRKRAAEGRGFIWKDLYLVCQHHEVAREYALLALCTTKALRL